MSSTLACERRHRVVLVASTKAYLRFERLCLPLARHLCQEAAALCAALVKLLSQ
jgi:hypothetical protein